MRGVRQRVVAVALLVMLVTSLLAGWVYWRLLDSTLENTARAYAHTQAETIAAALATVPPGRLLVPRPDGEYGDVMAQVVAADGGVLATTDERAGKPLLGPLPGPRSGRRLSDLPGLDDDAFWVVGRRATDAQDRPVTVVVAVPLHVEENQSNRMALLVVAAGSVLVLVTTTVTTWAVGAALAPVERMRAQLDTIGGSTLADRVDVPRTHDELERIGATMNTMLDRLEAAYGAQRKFVSDASHELRSPLATVRANVELASADPAGRAWAESRPVVLAELTRLQGLIDDLLTLSRSDAGALTLDLRDCDLDDLVVTQVRLAESRPGVTVDLSVQPEQVSADPARIVQVLRNLVDNGVRHARSQVRVRLAGDGTQAVLTVDNDGPVVPEGQRERVFDRFVRLDEARSRDSGGSGLGLAIAAEVTRAHGGTLTCGEAPDGWCRFELRVPRARP